MEPDSDIQENQHRPSAREGTVRKRTAVAALAAFVLGSLFAVGTAHATPSVSTTALPNGFGAIAVDAAHGHAFVSSPTANAITVLNYSGAVVNTISNEAGADGLVVDGGKLYVT